MELEKASRLRTSCLNCSYPGSSADAYDATSGKQFQIMVIPYSTVNLGGGVPMPDSSASASDQGDTLSDVNVDVDDIAEIWFTKNGVMYNVSCFKDDEPWLLSLLQTWRFQ